MKLNHATVLLVDDELELLEIFSAWLGRSGCRVLTAPNGAEALKILLSEKIDVLLSDIRMPVMDGVTLVRRIDELGLSIPSIMFVSGYGDVMPREMYALGVERLMEKPLSRKDLLRAMDESLMDREDLWLTPSDQPMDQSLVLELDSLAGAMETCTFQLGRGGCCLSIDRVLEERSIDLSIRFAQDGLCLKAQGKVRWYDKETSHVGVSFSYLEPECRAWTIAAMNEKLSHRFIPQCRLYVASEPAPNDAAASTPPANLILPKPSHEGRRLDTKVA
jgi:CheY-like chemotaxis protein